MGGGVETSPRIFPGLNPARSHFRHFLEQISMEIANEVVEIAVFFDLLEISKRPIFLCCKEKSMQAEALEIGFKTFLQDEVLCRLEKSECAENVQSDQV